MLKFLKEMWLDYQTVQSELAKMGIYNLPTLNGVWSFVDEPTLKDYLKKKEKENEST